MTTPYATLEATGGAPVELYRFVVDGVVYTYTSADVPVTFDAGFGSETYQPTILKRDKPESSAESTKLQLNVGLAITTPLAQQFVNGLAPSVATGAIYRFQRGANLAAGLGSDQIVSSYFGVVSSCRRQGAEAAITITPAQRTVQQTIPRFRMQVLCNHALYDAGCTMVKATFRLAATVASIGANGRAIGLAMGATGQPIPYYTGGLLEFGGYTGFIEVHNSTVGTAVDVTLLLAIPTLTVGASVNVLPGCDRTFATCVGKFNNLAHHFGFPWVVETDPWVTGIATG